MEIDDFKKCRIDKQVQTVRVFTSESLDVEVKLKNQDPPAALDILRELVFTGKRGVSNGFLAAFQRAESYLRMLEAREARVPEATPDGEVRGGA